MESGAPLRSSPVELLPLSSLSPSFERSLPSQTEPPRRARREGGERSPLQSPRFSPIALSLLMRRRNESSFARWQQNTEYLYEPCRFCPQPNTFGGVQME